MQTTYKAKYNNEESKVLIKGEHVESGKFQNNSNNYNAK